MLKIDRQRAIEDELHIGGSILISDMSQKLNVSRMEIGHQSHITGGDPWTHRFVETISIDIYGHGCGEAFLGGFCNFNYRTKYFLECVKQLLVGIILPFLLIQKN